MYFVCYVFGLFIRNDEKKFQSSEIQVDGAVDCLKIIQVRNDKCDGIFLI